MAEQRDARCAGGPGYIFEALRTFEPAVAEPACQLLLVGSEDVDSEHSMTIDRGKGGGLPIDTDQHAGRACAQRCQRRHSHARDVLVAARGDDADATRKTTHDGTKLVLDFVAAVDQMNVRLSHLSLLASRLPGLELDPSARRS